jgi:hypothetical protein
MGVLFAAAAAPAGTSVWATVAIAVGAALGAALISAIAVLAGTRIQGSQRRDEQKRDQMMVTANDFVSRVAAAEALYRDIVYRKASNRIDETRLQIDAASHSAARLRIAFGPEDEVTIKANTVISALVQAWRKWDESDDGKRSAAGRRIFKEIDGFTAVAHRSLWRSDGLKSRSVPELRVETPRPE